jgi:hypothetical protein
MKLKFNKENISMAISVFLSFAIFVPLIFTIMSPGVAENVIPELGECDITYNGVFYPCMTWREAYVINLKLCGIFGIVASIFILFSKSEEDEDIKKEKNIEGD